MATFRPAILIRKKEGKPMKAPDSLAQVAAIIEKELDKYLPPESTYPAIIYQAMRYSVLGGGKRLRAYLAVKSCEMNGGKAECAYPAACAIEMVHAYSLIHDDLPCMDNDDFRRGKPSNHKVFGEGMAVLAGDALLTRAFEVLCDAPHELEAATRISMIKELSAAAGCAGMIGGQTIDLQSEGKVLELSELAVLDAAKTGALIKAAARMGGLAAGAGANEMCALTAYAESFGLAFQITDDILDVSGESSRLGKATGSDAKKQKATYVSHYGLEQAKALAQHEVEKACQSLTLFGDKAADLIDLAESVLGRDQ
jgi:geranylgeranyl diphosphate synthase type II